MRRTRLFLPTLKETPAEAKIVSHRLMLRAGMVRQSAAGIYTWLPMGLRVLHKIAQIVREEQDRAGAQEVLMPTIQSAELWRGSGRYEDYGKEMLRITDRHDRELLYGPTAEEVITDIVANEVTSYRDLPKNLYNIQWKFRDEVRPRFGVMRGREFLMKDSYSFDLDYEAAKRSYNKMFIAYLRTFERMGLKAIPMAADSGPIGGDMSHEVLVLAETGESEVACHKSFMEMDLTDSNIDFDSDLQPLVDSFTDKYAATDEKRDPAMEAELGDDLVTARGIEVGHIFHFGDKYSAPFEANVTTNEGGEATVSMGSYGIGVSRLAGAIIEASHDENGIIWPEAMAPFQVAIVPIGFHRSEKTRQAAEKIYDELSSAGYEVLLDDRNERPGVMFADMELIGIPHRIVISERNLAENIVEYKSRKTGELEKLPLENLVETIKSKLC